MTKKTAPPVSERLKRKTAFIKQLAHFLVADQAGKSVMLEIEAVSAPVIPWAREWAKLRDATPLFGYPTVEEAEAALMDFLG